MRAVLIASLVWFGCKKAEDTSQKVVDLPVGSGGAAIGPKLQSEQVTPPFDLKNPPADAIKTSTGLIYKKLTTNDAGPAPKRNDTVMINYTGWKQTTGETFFTNQSKPQPMPLNLSQSALGFAEGLQLVKKGEKAMLWLPPAIGYRSGSGAAPQGAPETLVYVVEIVDIVSAPAIPPDVAKPPDAAEATKSGVKYVVVRPGTGKDKPRPFDNVTFQYTAWDSDTRMVETTESAKKKPRNVTPSKEPAALEEILTAMTVGERVRFWVAAEKMVPGGKPAPGMPQGQLCYEVEVVTIDKGVEPPATPPDVAKPPDDAKKTAKGVSYRLLKAGKGGPHPKPTDTVRVNYSGWTTDGKMFDSSVTRNEPGEFNLGGGVIEGWTDGIPVMSVGDKVRFWIPVGLAYKGAQGKPAGTLVFDVELLEIKGPPNPDMPPHHP